MEQTNLSFVLTEPKTQKAIYANDHFCKSTGYLSEEILNNNLNILKADNSDEKEREKIKEAIKINFNSYNFKK